jgi:hypothetical protein
VTADRLPGDGSEPSAALVAVLANRIADLLAQRIGERLVQLLADRRLDASIESPSSKMQNPSTSNRGLPAKTGEGLWSAREIAGHYGVTVNFVYQHADELGCIRLGAGKCPRLRFDPRLVLQRWGQIETPAVGPQVKRAPNARRASLPNRLTSSYELLDYEPEP